MSVDGFVARPDDATHWANIARQCLEHGLLDEIVIDLAPVLLGDGVPLVAVPGGRRVGLEPTDVPRSGSLVDRRSGTRPRTSASSSGSRRPTRGTPATSPRAATRSTTPSGSSPAAREPRALRAWKRGDVQEPARHRLYSARAVEHSLVAERDERVDVPLGG